jgi:small subunit ribosomal protein S1
MIHIGQVVEVIIDNVYPFGAFAHIEENHTRVYIRRRELTHSGNINPLDILVPSMHLKAIVIELSGEGRILEVSARKTLPDPWIQFAQEIRSGDIVSGTVKHLLHRGRFRAGIVYCPQLNSGSWRKNPGRRKPDPVRDNLPG